jgi:hypothetical protein
MLMGDFNIYHPFWDIYGKRDKLTNLVIRIMVKMATEAR